MTRRSMMFGLGTGAGAVALVGYAVRMELSTPSVCSACSRPIHEHMKVTARVGGDDAVFCCPACALWTHIQSNQPVRLTALTDFESGDALNPEEAFVVIGSNVNLCLRADHMLVGPNKQPNSLDFDRCTPSMISFRQQDAARSFAAEHSGTVTEFSGLLDGYVMDVGPGSQQPASL